MKDTLIRSAVESGSRLKPDVMVKTKNNQNSGFTLLEVMIAVAILAVALTTLLGSQSQSISYANSARFETMAALLAQSKMSELASRDGEALQSESGNFGEDYPGYTWRAEVSDVSLEGFEIVSDYMQQVDLTVSWGVFSYDARLYHYVVTVE